MNKGNLLSRVEALLKDIIQRVAELPDRSSPDEWPEAMLVTADELGAIVRDVVGAEVTRLQAENEKLRAWAQHKSECDTWKRLYSIAVKDSQGEMFGGMRTPTNEERTEFERGLKCTCGLADVLRSGGGQELKD